ncbi:hypothetical protein I7I48_11498 [Histoplasma ohiense]|nr:hypothetical protein I7I48_11498 [Histoplasma ohiense (nom. inval.)]
MHSINCKQVTPSQNQAKAPKKKRSNKLMYKQEPPSWSHQKAKKGYIYIYKQLKVYIMVYFLAEDLISLAFPCFLHPLNYT